MTTDKTRAPASPLLDEMERIVGDAANHRGCYTCAASPPYPTPGCDELTAEEEQDVIDYCVASGVTAEDSPTPGWPLDLAVVCPRWRAR